MTERKGTTVDGIFIPESTEEDRERLLKASQMTKNDVTYIDGKLPHPGEADEEKVDKVVEMVDQSTGTLDDMKALASRLDVVNSSYPATKAFLEDRGLTSVSQLDEQGRKDLEVFLWKALEHFTNNPT